MENTDLSLTSNDSYNLSVCFSLFLAPSCSSHEQLLSASLDEALLSALKGRPSFTSNLPQQKERTSDSIEPCQSSGFKITSAGTVGSFQGAKGNKIQFIK